ncbi:HlyD family efflux transporter periplasmic adaptor subunit [Exilibacterium tricleocarpae]|uniref:HlyD family efflux transporter periplasmic adaptor subunit n=1 Tax=Exilibacterium tricleocarpae TaxID=2591008 RepID=A0A545U466_9GAMM|nr:HlyD family efflux transporter periplasmic adaptor subunit [Exilibacterium tricleocarpae]TQV84262.1 HlyD family efflux transporter periplasmic adaptor subunit [Exilibacterium tricleocarpae]
MLARPMSFSVITGLIFAILFISGLYLSLSSYTKSIGVKGVLKTTEGMTKVFAFEEGTVIDLYVEEGDIVEEGDALYKIGTDRDGATGSINTKLAEDLKESYALVEQKIQYQQEIMSLDAEEFTKKIDGKKITVAHIEEEIELKRKHLSLLSSELSAAKKLLDKKIIPKNEYNVKYSQFIEVRISIKEMERQRGALLEEIASGQSNLKNMSLKGRSLVTEYRQTLNELKRQLADVEAKKFYIINAPSSGTVASIFFLRGYFIETNKPLMTMLPLNSEIVAEIYIPSRSVAQVYTEQPINLRYAAFPYQTYGLYRGKIQSISKSLIEPFQAKVQELVTEPSYRAIVELEKQEVDGYGKSIRLQSGMLLNADIVGERRSLLAWFFSPVLDVFRSIES